MSDRALLHAGRRKALFGAVVTSLVFGVASALSPDYWWYAVLRAFTGASYTGHLEKQRRPHPWRTQRS